MDLGQHAAFIWSAYAATGIVIAGLIIRAVLEERKQRQALIRLEAQGIRRRSDAHRKG